MGAPATGLAIADRRAGCADGLAFSTLSGDSSGGLLAEWAALAGRSAGDNVFFDPEFAVPAIRLLGEGDVAIATVATSSGRLAALTLFTRARLGHIAPAIRLWSHGYAPLGLPLVDARAVEDALAALVDGLAPADSGLSLVVPDLPLDSAVAAALALIADRGGRPLALLDDHRRAMLERPGAGAVDLRAALPARRRKELGRQMRRMAELGAVSVETATESDCVRARFEEFLALEGAGWKGRRGTALASSAEVAEFAREVVRNRAAAGAMRIDAIRVGAHAVAMVVSLVAGGTAWTWKIAYDEAYAHFSPGAQLMLEAPAHIFSDPDVKRIDSCAVADHPMIDRLWPGRLPIATVVLGPPGGGVLHRLGLAAAKAETAARANVRQLRERLG